jgi:hypothetical protein
LVRVTQVPFHTMMPIEGQIFSHHFAGELKKDYSSFICKTDNVKNVQLLTQELC